MSENEKFLQSIGFTQEEYMNQTWWVDPYFEKDDQYRYVFQTEGSYAVQDKTLEWIMKVIKSNVAGSVYTKTQQKAKQDAVNEIQKVMKKFLK